MEMLLSLVAFTGFTVACCVLPHLWEEWHGAYGRWRRGEPLRASALQALRLLEESKRREQRKAELRQMYNLNPNLILDFTFRHEFERLGIDKDIFAEVMASSDRRCAACGVQFSIHIRKSVLVVGEILPRKFYPHLMYNLSNLHVMCLPCASHKLTYVGEDWKEVVAARRRATKQRLVAERRASKLLEN